jgi:hypothetical protein
MLPPDEGNKNTGIWSVIKNVFGKIFKKFGSKDILKEQVFKTLDAMLYELEDSLNKPDKERFKLHSLVMYLLTILSTFKKTFFELYDRNIEKLELV